MVNHKKEVHIVSGPNGSGKTTFVKRFLPEYANVTNFVNADDIAVGLSPLDYTAMNIKSGKLMLELIDEYKDKGEAFGFETTLAGRRWIKMIKELKTAKYNVHIFFLDLSSVDLAVARVRYRVEGGGHTIPEETIRRRYYRARYNFWYNYKDLVDSWYLFDNSGKSPELVVSRNKTDKLGAMALKAFKEAVKKALKRHQQMGVPAVFMQRGKMVYLMPDGRIVNKVRGRKRTA